MWETITEVKELAYKEKKSSSFVFWGHKYVLKDLLRGYQMVVYLLCSHISTVHIACLVLLFSDLPGSCPLLCHFLWGFLSKLPWYVFLHSMVHFLGTFLVSRKNYFVSWVNRIIPPWRSPPVGLWLMEARLYIVTREEMGRTQICCFSSLRKDFPLVHWRELLTQGKMIRKKPEVRGF